MHWVFQLDQGQVASAWLEVDVDDAHSELTDLVLLPVQVAEADVAVVDADADVVELGHTVLCCGDKVLGDEGASTELGPCKDIFIFIKILLTIIEQSSIIYIKKRVRQFLLLAYLMPLRMTLLFGLKTVI